MTDRFPIRTPQPSFLSYPLPSYAPDIMRTAIAVIYAHGASEKLKHLSSALTLAKDILFGKRKAE